MKNKLKILSVLSIAGACAALGLAAANSTPTYAMPIQNQHLLMANADVNTGSQYIRQLPESWVTEGTAVYGGIKYTITSSRAVYAYPVENPEEVTELILYDQLGRNYVSYRNFDVSNYTSLQNVVVVGNDMSFISEVLSNLKSGVNLYTSGACNFGSAIPTMTFENIYLCNVYSSSLNTIIDSQFTRNLESSNIKHIYYNDFFEQDSSYYINKFIEGAYKNKNGEDITMSKASNIPYPDYVFYPFETFDPSSSVLGGKSFYVSSSSGHVTRMTDLTEKVYEVDSRVKDLALTNIKCGNDLDNSRSYGKLYFRNIDSYNFAMCTADEVIFAPVSMAGYSLNLEYFRNIKCIRVLPSKRVIPFSGTISANSDLKKILIPKSQEADYTVALSQPELQGVIELYDDLDYHVPNNSYTSIDGKDIKLSYATEATIEEAEYIRSHLDSLHINYDGLPIDTIAEEYEFPTKEAYEINNYDIRNCTKIIVPKNIDAKDALSMFKDVLVTNNGRTCDPEGFSIKAVDDSDYTVGYNGKLTVTVKFADNTEKTFELFVRTMNVDGNYGYLMDDNGNISIVGPKTNAKTELSVLLEPLMENYLMETNVEYTESEILDTSAPTFNCGNKYKAAASSGKVRVWLTNDSLVEETPSQGETNPPSTDDDPSNNETPSEQTTDTDGIDTEGYVMRNVTKIYTTESIDGSKLLSGLRDDMLTINGEKGQVSFAVAYNPHTNKEPWRFTIFDTITSSDKYRKTIDVEIIKHSLNMGFVMFEDGTIAVEYNTYEKYTPTQIKNGIVEFLNSKNINSENVSIPSEFNRNGVFYGTYSGGGLILVDSGYNLSYTTKDLPTDQTKDKEGYQGLHTIYYTNDFTVEEALRAVSRNFLLKDGKLVENYSIEFTTKEDSKYVSYVIKDCEKEILKDSVLLQKIESDYSYVFGRMYHYDYGCFVIKKMDKAPEYKVEDIIKDGLTHFRTLMRPFTTKTEVDFTKISKEEVKGVYEIGNGSYYEYEYIVDVVDLDHVVRANECIVDGKAQTGETFVDKVNDFFGDMKTKFEENKAFKIGAIAIGSITGLLLLYGFYVLIKKIFKLLKK